MNKFKLGCILSTSVMGATVVVPPIVVAAIEDNRDISFYRNINLDKGWLFRLNSEEQGQIVDLPHDFSIIQKFKHSYFDLRKKLTSGTTGFLPGGVGYYHKELVLPKRDNPTVILNFDGAYNDTTLIVNGQVVGNNQYGYNPFAFDISNYVKADGVTENTIDVIVKHKFITSSRWYPGSGIYRDVKLSILDKVHIANNGTYVTTPFLKQEVGKDVTVNVEVEVQNSNKKNRYVYVKNRVVDAQGNPVSDWINSETLNVKGSESTFFNTQLKVNNPLLWSSDSPNLYFVETQVVDEGAVVDEYKTRFGFRYFEFDKQGFKVNGKLTKLYGVCLHHDQGALGAAAYNDAIYRQLTIMKDAGMNAVRTSHNCPDEDLLRMCDELGLYVMDEAFDGWEFAKTKHDFSDMWKEEIGVGNHLIDSTPDMQWHTFAMRNMVKRDRNCPSIFLWSLGNELHEGDWHEPDVTPERKKEIEEEMVGYATEFQQKIVAELDHDSNTRRWCGTALESDPNPGSGDENIPKCLVAKTLHKNGGLLGFNYGDQARTLKAIDNFGRVYGSETASAQCSRGMYSIIAGQEDERIMGTHHRVTSYDAAWAQAPASEVIYRTLAFDGYGGQFIWTGFDYIGEPSPWCWNCESDNPDTPFKLWPYPNSAYYGIVDTCGFPKDSYYLYRANFKKDDTTLHLVGSLNPNNMYIYPDGLGFPKGYTPIDIYTNAPFVSIMNQDKEIARIAKNSSNPTTKNNGTFDTYNVEYVDDDICKWQETETKQKYGHDLYSNILVDPTRATYIHAEAYQDADHTKPIRNTKGLKQLNQIDHGSKQIHCYSDKPTITADGKSLAYITVDLIDGEGDLITDYNAQVNLQVSWTGNGQVLGVDNGDQETDKKFQNPEIYHKANKTAEIKTYAGKALIIVCSDTTPGQITLKINDQYVHIDVV